MHLHLGSSVSKVNAVKRFGEGFILVSASRGSLNLFNANVSAKNSTPAIQMWPATSFYAAVRPSLSVTMCRIHASAQLWRSGAA